jgi:hypothetical protein
MLYETRLAIRLKFGLLELGPRPYLNRRLKPAGEMMRETLEGGISPFSYHFPIIDLPTSRT